MHSAKISKSDRLQRVLKLLMDGNKHTTRDIIRKAKVCAVNSIISEIMDNGFRVECERKANKWSYWLPKVKYE